VKNLLLMKIPSTCLGAIAHALLLVIVSGALAFFIGYAVGGLLPLVTGDPQDAIIALPIVIFGWPALWFLGMYITVSIQKRRANRMQNLGGFPLTSKE
jgi:hypothetical protein